MAAGKALSRRTFVPPGSILGRTSCRTIWLPRMTTCSNSFSRLTCLVSGLTGAVSQAAARHSVRGPAHIPGLVSSTDHALLPLPPVCRVSAELPYDELARRNPWPSLSAKVGCQPDLSVRALIIDRPLPTTSPPLAGRAQDVTELEMTVDHKAREVKRLQEEVKSMLQVRSSFSCQPTCLPCFSCSPTSYSSRRITGPAGAGPHA